MNKSAGFAMILILGCVTQQPDTMAAPQVSATVAPAQVPRFKNLEVLPAGIPKDELIEMMKGFTRSLGVRCGHCHVVTATEPKEVFDFPADTEHKQVARVMIQMTDQLNGAWMERVEEAEGHAKTAAGSKPSDPLKISCWTCHRGEKKPAKPPPPAGTAPAP